MAADGGVVGVGCEGDGGGNGGDDVDHFKKRLVRIITSGFLLWG